MDQTTEDKIMNELSIQIAQLSYDKARLKVLYAEAIEELTHLKSVLEHDKDLNDLFNETEERMNRPMPTPM
jgi:hypothetical protein